MSPAAAWIGILCAVVAAASVAIAGSQHGAQLGEVPVFALCVALALVVQWLAFVPAFLWQREHFFDLTGSLTFIGLSLLALAVAHDVGARALTIGACTMLWALRLGTFLTLRIRARGSDRRFNSIKPVFSVFLMTWTLQGLWVTCSYAPGLAALTSSKQVPPDAFLLVGACLWLLGFVVEVVADEQKRRFRASPQNEDGFITTGLWALSQHPNYFGEILLWAGIAVMALPVLEGWQHLTLISPVFVWLLLMRISGARMLDASAKRRWGDDPAFQAYIARTPKLLPLPAAKMN